MSFFSSSKPDCTGEKVLTCLFNPSVYSLTNWNKIGKKYLFCFLASVSGVYSQSALWQDTDQLLVLGCNTQAKYALKLWWSKYSTVLILDSCATPLGPKPSAVFSQKWDLLILLFSILRAKASLESWFVKTRWFAKLQLCWGLSSYNLTPVGHVSPHNQLDFELSMAAFSACWSGHFFSHLEVHPVHDSPIRLEGHCGRKK